MLSLRIQSAKRTDFKVVDKKFELLVNPFPILPVHYTIPAKEHISQTILANYGEIHKLLNDYGELMVFYNGPKCGASAPDHMHLQAGTSGVLPLQKSWQRLSRNLTVVYTLAEGEDISVVSDYPCPAILIRSKSQDHDERLFRYVYDSLPWQDDDTEPMMNIVAWRQDATFFSVVFPRRKHRPDCYFAQGDEQILVSPGASICLDLSLLPEPKIMNG